MKHASQFLILFLLSIFTASNAQATLVVSGNPLAFAPNSTRYSWEGDHHARLRAALEDSTNFGSGGIGGNENISTIDLSAINSATLSNLDIFVSSWWQEGDSAPFHSVLIDWFFSGGNLLLLQDASDRDGLGGILGIPTIDGSTNPTTVTGVLGNGPFGEVGSINQIGSIGNISNSTITANGGQIYGTNASGEATIAAFKKNVLGPDAGALVVLADVNLLPSASDGSFSPLSAKGRLALNIFSFFETEIAAANADAPAIPTPSTLPVLLTGLSVLGLGVMTRRKTRQRV